MFGKSRHIFTSALTGYARFFTSFIILWFLTPYVIKSVGIDDFGLWTLIFSILGFYELLDLGFANGIIKYVAEYDALKDYSRRNQLLSTILFVYFLLALIGMIGVAGLAMVFDDLFAIPKSQSQKALLLLGVLSLRSLLLGLPASLFRGILYGEKKISLVNAISTTSSLLYGITAFTAMALGYGIVALGVLTSLTFFFEAFAYVIASFYLAPQLNLSWQQVDLRRLRELGSFCLMQFVANVSSLLILKSDPIIIQLFLSIFYVSIYAVPLRIVTYVYMFINQFTDVLSPFIAHLHAASQHYEIRSILLQCTKYAVALSTLFFICGTLLADRLILLWLGEQFSLSIMPLIILLTAMWVNSTYLVAAQVLAMSGHHRLLTFYFLFTASLHLAFSIAFIYPWGINGVATATLMSGLIGFVIYNKKVCNLFKVDYSAYFRTSIAPVIIPGIGLGIAIMTMREIMPISNLPMLILSALPGILIFTGLFWVLALDQEERHTFLGLIYAKVHSS